MSARMFKYQIALGQTDVALPEGTAIRSVGLQGTTICLWAETPQEERPLVKHSFRVVGTGFTVPEEGTYLGTVFDGPFVWHIYEVA